MRELVIDTFAGGGGASLGIEQALGRSPDVAINHDAEAVRMHEANHPETIHLCGDIWEYDPRSVSGGRSVGLLWASPDCKHFSKAKGGAVARSKKIRSLAWSTVKYARLVGPRVIALENVEEFQTWGPLDENGIPDPARRGTTFRRWLSELRSCGYKVEWRELRACDYGAPTTRKRLFIIARNDGQPIVWPEPTHGPGLLPYRKAAECIDWTIPVPSIFGRSKPLAESTLRRIARGVRRFVLDYETPFLVATPQGLVAPMMTAQSWGERKGQAPRIIDIEKPLGTIVAGGIKQALVYVFLAKHYGGNETPGSPVSRPFDTITCTDHHGLVAVEVGPSARENVRDFCAARDLGDGALTIGGQRFVITDIGHRMLAPRELFRAQGFPDSYVIDPIFKGKPMTKTAQTRMCGNSVSPLLSKAIVEANFFAEEMGLVA